MAKSDYEFNPQELLNEFATMCHQTPAPNGDWQGDGWGVAWQEDGRWRVHRSLQPIWEEREVFASILRTHVLAAHARSAGIPTQVGDVTYNQPYVKDPLCFVFNGMVRGVRLTRPVDGAIGAQKIFSLLQHELQQTKNTEQAMRSLLTELKANARSIEGLNIGLVRDSTFALLCEYTHHPDYFALRYHRDASLTLVCSSALPSYSWQTVNRGAILVL